MQINLSAIHTEDNVVRFDLQRTIKRGRRLRIPPQAGVAYGNLSEKFCFGALSRIKAGYEMTE